MDLLRLEPGGVRGPSYPAVLECPASFVPVAMRQTGTRGAMYGTRKEAYGGADREPAAAGWGWGGEWQDGAAGVQGNGKRGADGLPVAEGGGRGEGRPDAAAQGGCERDTG